MWQIWSNVEKIPTVEKTASVLIIEIETPASHSKWSVTQNGMSLKIECHSKWNVTQNGMPF